MRALVLAAAAWVAATACTLADNAPPWCDAIAFQLDNDFTLTKDDGYTNGLRLRCARYDDQVEDLAGFSSRIYSIGHSIYTPENLARRSLQDDDQPYAGHVFAQFDGLLDGGTSTTRLSAQIGLVGPAAGGEEIQDLIHEVTNAESPAGWDNQLENEPTINIGAKHSWRIGTLPPSNDLLALATADFGSVRTSASAGLFWRYGNLDPAGGVPDASRLTSGLHARRSVAESFLFVGVQGEGVVRDLFLDGNLARDSHSIDRSWFLGTASVGGVMQVGAWSLGFTQFFQTATFDGEDPTGFGRFHITRKF